MLKKSFLLFLVLILLSSSAAAENNHITLIINSYAHSKNNAEVLDVLPLDDRILIFSEHFPDCYISIPFLKCHREPDGNNCFHPFGTTDFQEMARKWSSGFVCETANGIFTGDAFDEASTVSSGFCEWDEFISFVQMIMSSCFGDSISPGPTAQNVVGIQSAGITDMSSVRIFFSIFDSGKYLAFTGKNNDSIVFTMSFDFSCATGFRVIHGHAEGGKNYYWAADFNADTEKNLSVEISLLADFQQAGYKAVANDNPVIRGIFRLVLSEDFDTLSVSSVLYPQNDLDNILIHCDYCPNKHEILFTEISFSGEKGSLLSIEAKTDDSVIDYENLHEITIADYLNSADSSVYGTELSSGMETLCSFFMDVLPDSYKNRLFELLF